MENAIHRVVARGDRRTNGARLQDTGLARERAVTVCVCARAAKAIFTTCGHANSILNTDKKRPVPDAQNVGRENCVSE